MKELSLNILDITENSVKAGASLTEILIDENDTTIKITIKDDGSGMPEEIVKSVANPFYTTRTTRKVGLGIPLLKLAAEQTGGNINIKSKMAEKENDSHGTTVEAIFYKNHIDFTPLGDIVSTVTTLIQGHPNTDFLFLHRFGAKEVCLDTRELRAVLEEVPLNDFEVILWIKDNLEQAYSDFDI